MEEDDEGETESGSSGSEETDSGDEDGEYESETDVRAPCLRLASRPCSRSPFSVESNMVDTLIGGTNECEFQNMPQTFTYPLVLANLPTRAATVLAALLQPTHHAPLPHPCSLVTRCDVQCLGVLTHLAFIRRGRTRPMRSPS